MYLSSIGHDTEARPHHDVIDACYSSGHGPRINSSHAIKSMTAAQYGRVRHRPFPEFHLACFFYHRTNGKPSQISPPVPKLVGYRDFLTLRDRAFLIRHFPKGRGDRRPMRGRPRAVVAHAPRGASVWPANAYGGVGSAIGWAGSGGTTATRKSPPRPAAPCMAVVWVRRTLCNGRLLERPGW